MPTYLTLFRYLNFIKYIFHRSHKMQYEIHCHVIDKFYFQNKIIFPIYLYAQVLRRHHIQLYELFNYFSHLRVKIFLSILALYGNCDLMCNNTAYIDFINIHFITILLYNYVMFNDTSSQWQIKQFAAYKQQEMYYPFIIIS